MSFKGEIGEVVETLRGNAGFSSFEWRIPGFPSLAGKGGDRYESPSFDACDGRWRFPIYPNGLSRIPKSDWVSLYLWRLGEGPPQTLNVILGIRGPEGVVNKRGRRQEFSKDDPACFWFMFCSRTEVSEQRSRLMPGDVLILSLDMKSVVPKVARGVCSLPGPSIQVAPTDNSQSSDKQGQQSSNKCVICLEGSVDTALSRCGHMYTCYDCALKLWKSNSLCPICRKPIQDILKIYSDYS